MNHWGSFRRLFVYLLVGTGVGSCIPWDLPTECTEALPSSLNVTAGPTVTASASGNSATWSLVNSSGSVVLSSSGTSLSFNPTSLAGGNYTIRASGRNGCGFKFDLSQVYIRASFTEIPGGTFQIGDTRGEGDFVERPIRSVTVSSFQMGRYEVTQAQWESVMGNNPSQFTNCPNCPVERVSWYDAIDFCNRLSDREGRQRVYTGSGDNITANWSANGYRLPTEAEWEYAAGGGASSNRTRFGNGRDILVASEANFDARVDYKELYSDVGIYRERTVGVGSFIPNRFGLYDMSGNVWEWCWDWGGNYPSQSQTNPRGPSLGDYRVVRGGSYGSNPYRLRVASRGYTYPDESGENIGFRVVVSQ